VPDSAQVRLCGWQNPVCRQRQLDPEFAVFSSSYLHLLPIAFLNKKKFYLYLFTFGFSLRQGLYAAQLLILLPLAPEDWDYRCVHHQALASMNFFE
jgi:hypothetical protein